MADLGGLST